MPTPPTTKLRRLRSVVALTLRILAATGCAHAMAQPPAATAALAAVSSTSTTVQSAQPTPARRAQLKPARLPPPPSALERLGGEHARRAMRVAQGVPAGRIALRPMFWMTRDRSGAVIALGGRF